MVEPIGRGDSQCPVLHIRRLDPLGRVLCAVGIMLPDGVLPRDYRLVGIHQLGDEMLLDLGTWMSASKVTVEDLHWTEDR